MKNMFTNTNIIFALAIAIIGLILIIIGGSIPNDIGSILLISGVYTIIDSMFLKARLIDLIIQKINLKKEIDESGLIKINYVLTEIPYREYFNTAKGSIDIVHNYARTWTSQNIDFVKQAVMNKKCSLRIALLNPESPFISALENHYGYKEGDLKKFILESTETWKKLYLSVEQERNASKKKKKNLGTVELYYFNGQPGNSIYRIGQKMIVINATNSGVKSIYLPFTIYENNGEKSLYNNYLKEIESIFKKATKVDFTGVIDNGAN